MSIQVSGISKQFGDFKALHDVSLDFNSGELVAKQPYCVLLRG
jgi:sulfate/thiosulfate transport system ATP-binding protein